MELSKEELNELKKFYEFVGLQKSSSLNGAEIMDIFRLLKIKPEVDSNGIRKLTPYEILEVPPQFIDGKRERPIVFAIKNRAKKVGKPSVAYGKFIYQSKKVKEEDSILEQIIEEYKHAVFCGNDADAQKYMDLIDALSNGKAAEIVGSFYDYRKFYKQMKKQLLIDIFSHFFLLYLQSRSLTIKKGIIKGGKVYRAYREDERYVEEEISVPNFGIGMNPDMPAIRSISVQGASDDFEKRPKVRESKEPVYEDVVDMSEVVSSIQNKVTEEKNNIKESLEKYGNIRNKSEDYIEQMLRDNPLNPPKTKEPEFFEEELEENLESEIDYSSMLGDISNLNFEEFEKNEPAEPVAKDNIIEEKLKEKYNNENLMDKGRSYE